MADIELVIKIPEDKYKRFVKAPRTATFDECISDRKVLGTAIANGTPLPKGHGRIGDLDVARGKIKGYQDLIRNIGKLTPDKASDLILLGRCAELIDEVDSIIEADKESE